MRITSAMAAGLLGLALLGTASRVAASSPADTATIAAAQAAYDKGDYGSVLRLVKPLADAGNVEAQYDMGQLYEYGLGVPEDQDAAMDWYRKAADQGDAAAEDKVGVLVLNNDPSEETFAAAADWERKAAAQGYAPAEFNLGHLDEIGIGLPQDSAAAVAWYRKAADQGEARAQMRLGLMYIWGAAVAEDDAAGLAWLEKAAAQKSPAAEHALGVLYFAGLGVPRDYVKARTWFDRMAGDATDPMAIGPSAWTPYFVVTGLRDYTDRLIAAQDQPPGPSPAPVDCVELVRAFSELSAGASFADTSDEPAPAKPDPVCPAHGPALGDPFAMVLPASAGGDDFAAAAQAYRTGDFATALRLWTPLAATNPQAQYALGVMNYNGEGTATDPGQAMTWFYKAAIQGMAEAQYDLGRIDDEHNQYEAGEEALPWYLKAAEQGHAGAEYALYFSFRNPGGPEMDDMLGQAWLKKAADQGDSKAAETLGFSYFFAMETPKDYVQAYKWYTVAANLATDNKDRSDALTHRADLTPMMTPDQITAATVQAAAWRAVPETPQSPSKVNPPL